MRLRQPGLIIAAVILLLATACNNQAPAQTQAAESAPTVSAIATAETATTAPLPSNPPATRIGADYVLLLPRESALPAGWAFSPSPDYETRRPQPGDTYRFACLDLPVRSVAVATVGYRSLEGLPNVYVEYVIYPTAADADAALEDMRRATETCAEFTIGEGDAATAAAFAPLNFPSYGEAGFAAALSTDSPVTGRLLTHMVKIREGHVVIGINHANRAGEAPPDAALTEALAALTVSNLADGPSVPND